MASISQTSQNGTGNFEFVTSYTHTIPGGWSISSGDVIVACFANDQNSNPTTGPGGSWSEQINISGAGPKNEAVYTLVAAGTEAGTDITVTCSSSAGWISSVLLITSANGVDVAAEGTQSFGTSHDSPTATATAAGLALYGLQGYTGSDLDWDGTPPTHPSGTTLSFATSGEFAEISRAIAYESVSSGATGAQTWTTGSINGTPWTLVISDAAVGGGSILPLLNAYYS